MSLVIIANLKRIQIIRKGFSANFEQPFVSNMLEVLEETKNLSFFFSVRVFFTDTGLFTGQQRKAEDHFLFHSTTSTRSRTLRHLFATLHVR